MLIPIMMDTKLSFRVHMYLVEGITNDRGLEEYSEGYDVKRRGTTEDEFAISTINCKEDFNREESGWTSVPKYARTQDCGIIQRPGRATPH